MDKDALDKYLDPPPKSASYYFGLWLGEWLFLKGIPLALAVAVITVVAFLTWKACAWAWDLVAS